MSPAPAQLSHFSLGVLVDHGFVRLCDLKVLESAGLITRGRDAQWRPCRIDAGGLREIADWIAPYRALWEARLDRLGDHLRTMQAGKSRRGRTRRQGRSSGRS